MKKLEEPCDYADYKAWAIEVEALLLLCGIPLNSPTGRLTSDMKKKQRAIIVLCLGRSVMKRLDRLEDSDYTSPQPTVQWRRVSIQELWQTIADGFY